MSLTQVDIASHPSKMEMIASLFPDQAKRVHFAVVDMDITLLSIADILRNIHDTFPKNTSIRNAIANGQTAVAVLCRTALIKPLQGIIIVVTKDAESVQVKSKDYIIAGVAESTISDNGRIADMLDNFTTYLIQNYGSDIETFEKFYTLYVYDAYELEDQ